MSRILVVLAILLGLNPLTLHAEEPRITDIAWNSDGTLLAIGWDDINAPLEIRNIETGESHFYNIGLSDNGYRVRIGLAWSPTVSNRIAILNHTSTVFIFTIEGDEVLLEYGLRSFVNNRHIDWNADGTQLAIIGENGAGASNYDGIQIWNADTGEKRVERISDSPYTLAVDWHPSNPDLLVYTTFENGWGASTFQWDVAPDTRIWSTGYMEDGSINVAWNPLGTIVAGFSSSLYGDIGIHLYDGLTGEILSTVGWRFGDYTGEILWLDNTHILIHTRILEVWNIDSQQLIYEIEGTRYMIDWHPIGGLAYLNEDNNLIIVAPEDIPGIT